MIGLLLAVVQCMPYHVGPDVYFEIVPTGPGVAEVWLYHTGDDDELAAVNSVMVTMTAPDVQFNRAERSNPMGFCCLTIFQGGATTAWLFDDDCPAGGGQSICDSSQTVCWLVSSEGEHLTTIYYTADTPTWVEVDGYVLAPFYLFPYDQGLLPTGFWVGLHTATE